MWVVKWAALMVQLMVVMRAVTMVDKLGKMKAEVKEYLMELKLVALKVVMMADSKAGVLAC